MTKETIVNDRNGEKRIVKRSKLKISIIVIVVLLILSLIGVGIYFIVKATKKYDYEVEGVELKADISDVRDDILDNTNGDKVGIFFYTEDSAEANYLFRGDSVYSEGEDGAGALSEVMTSSIENDGYTWYGINIADEENLIEEFFITEANEDHGNPDAEPYMLYDQFEYLAGGDRDQDIWYFDNIDYNSFASPTYELDDGAKYPKFELKLNDENSDSYEDDPTDIYLTTSDDGETDSESVPEEWQPTTGTMMMFDGTLLTSVVDGWTIPPSSSTTDETDTDVDTELEVKETFISSILEVLLDHNTVY